MTLTFEEQRLNHWLKDLGRVGGRWHAGPMMMLKPDGGLPLPYTCTYQYDLCVDCWVRGGNDPHLYILNESHQCS